MNLVELGSQIGAKIQGDGANAVEITGISSVGKAGSTEVTFLTNPKYTEALNQSQAAAVIVGKPIEGCSVPFQLVHPNPYAAMAKAAQLFYQVEHSFEGQSPLAFVHDEADVHESVVIYPFVHIDRGVQVGEGVVLYPGVFLGEGVQVGSQSVLYPNVTVMNGTRLGENVIIHSNVGIGGDGFGFAPTGNGPLEKIPQVGGVRIEDNVEIGACSTVDRGALQDTILGMGSKLDSQVHIAQGAQLGRHCMLCGQSEIAGSTVTGDHLVMAGQSAIGPSLEVADHVVLGPKAGLTNSQKSSGTYMGMPLSPVGDWRKQAAALKQLPDLVKKVRKLEKQLAALQEDGLS